MNFHSFPIVILCGGKSSRMKRDKSLIPFAQSNSLSEFQYNRLCNFFKTIYISAKDEKFVFLEDRSKIIFDTHKDIFSPLIALKSILEELKNCKKVFILSVDTPFVKIHSIIKMMEMSKDFDIVIAQTPEKTHNLCGVFSTSLIDKIDILLKDNNHKINYLIKQTNHKILKFENENEFLNLNTPNEYEKALKLI